MDMRKVKRVQSRGCLCFLTTPRGGFLLIFGWAGSGVAGCLCLFLLVTVEIADSSLRTFLQQEYSFMFFLLWLSPCYKSIGTCALAAPSDKGAMEGHDDACVSHLGSLGDAAAFHGPLTTR